MTSLGVIRENAFRTAAGRYDTNIQPYAGDAVIIRARQSIDSPSHFVSWDLGWATLLPHETPVFGVGGDHLGILCDPGAGVFTLGTISPCLPANNSCGVLMGVYDQGCTIVGVEPPLSPGPAALELAPIQPNPFRSEARIAFTLPADGHVRLRVFDVTGRRLATLAEGMCAAGAHQVTWDGCDDAGRAVASGLHFVQLEAMGRTLVRRVAVVR